MDRIALRRVRANGRHGFEAGERERPQTFEIDLEIDLDLEAARESDQLGDTIDYASLHARIVRLVETTSHALLERLAGELLATAFEDPRIARAEVTVAKPEILDGATPAVTLRRDNPRYGTQ